MSMFSAIIATINPHQTDALIAGLVVVGVALLATYAKDIKRWTGKSK